MVDQSLLRQAADRGVTICFADLDGADGLWVPEERTVLVNRGLSEAKVAEVIEHELGHVMIDDQHADLDAGKEVLAGRPPARYRRLQTVALAAASLLAVVGGAVYGVTAMRGDVKADQVAPNPDGPGLSANESADGTPTPRVVASRGPDGRIVYVTLSAGPATPSATASPTATPTPTPTASPSAPQRTAGSTTSAPPAPAQTTSAPAPTPSTPPQVPPTDAPTATTSVPPPPDESGGAGDGGVGDGTGDQGAGGAGPVPTEPVAATVADVSVAAPSDVGGTSGP